MSAADDEAALRRRNLRTALLLAVLALGVYVLFFALKLR